MHILATQVSGKTLEQLARRLNPQRRAILAVDLYTGADTPGGTDWITIQEVGWRLLCRVF
jgi:hypothetical protein